MPYVTNTFDLNFLSHIPNLRIGIIDHNSYFSDRKVKVIIDTLVTIFNRAKHAKYYINVNTQPLRGEVEYNLKTFHIPPDCIKWIGEYKPVKNYNIKGSCYDTANETKTDKIYNQEYTDIYSVLSEKPQVVFYYTDHLHDAVHDFIKSAKLSKIKVITIRSDGDIIDWDNPPERVDDYQVYGGY